MWSFFKFRFYLGLDLGWWRIELLGHPISFWSRFIQPTMLNAIQTIPVMTTFCAQIGSLSFYAIVFQISFSFGTRPWLMADWIAGAFDFILVLSDCGDSSEISLLPMFLLTSVTKNPMLPMNSDQQTYWAIYECFWHVPLIRKSSIVTEKAL